MNHFLLKKVTKTQKIDESYNFFLAAHCVVNQPKENIFCILGTHNISNWLVNDHVLRGLRLVNVHFEYRPQNISSDADVAILTMQKEVEFQRNIRPICLWHNNKGTADNLIDRMGLVAGWGKSSADNDFNEIPRSITMPIVRTSDCYGSSFNFFSILSNRTFCAGKQTRFVLLAHILNNFILLQICKLFIVIVKNDSFLRNLYKN